MAGLIDTLLFWGCTPWAVWQGMRLRSRMARLPEACGRRRGRTGHAPALRVLVLGDSIVAGVGIAEIAAALPGRFAEALGERVGGAVAWCARGRSGARMADMPTLLAHGRIRGRFDLLLVSAGTNDIVSMTPVARFRAQLSALLTTAGERWPGVRPVLAGLPPFDRFVQLPQPLRSTLARRSRVLDAELARAAQTYRALHVPLCLQFRPDRFCADQYHPNSECHAEWAATLADSAWRMIRDDSLAGGDSSNAMTAAAAAAAIN